MQPANKQNKSNDIHCARIGELLERENIVIDPAKTQEFNGISMTRSDIWYLDEKNNKCKLYIEAPPQVTFGISYVFDMAIKDEKEKIPQNAKGLQVCYPITSLATCKTPTPEEKSFRNNVDLIFDLVWEEGVAQSELENAIIPAPSVAAFLTAVKKNNPKYAVKPPYEYPNVPDKKIKDTTKPQRMYVKLSTTGGGKGKGDTLKCQTTVWGPGDIKVSPLKYINQKGEMGPVFLVDGIYWGAHGQKSFGASITLRLAQATFTPIKGGRLTGERLVGPNSAGLEQDISDNEAKMNSKRNEDYTDQAKGFENSTEERDQPPPPPAPQQSSGVDKLALLQKPKPKLKKKKPVAN